MLRPSLTITVFTVTRIQMVNICWLSLWGRSVTKGEIVRNIIFSITGS